MSAAVLSASSMPVPASTITSSDTGCRRRARSTLGPRSPSVPPESRCRGGCRAPARSATDASPLRARVRRKCVERTSSASAVADQVSTRSRTRPRGRPRRLGLPLGAGQLEKVVDQRGEAGRLVDRRHRTSAPRRLRHVGLEVLEPKPQRRQRGPELMGGVGHEGPLRSISSSSRRAMAFIVVSSAASSGGAGPFDTSASGRRRRSVGRPPAVGGPAG